MLLTPIFHYNLNVRIGYYYCSLLIYIIGTPILSFIQHFYTILNLDNFNWNKKDVNKEMNKKDVNVNLDVNKNDKIKQQNNDILDLDDYIIIETLV